MPLSELIINYYQAILLLTDEDDILHSLPYPIFEEFYPVMNGLIEILNNEKQELTEEILTETDSDMLLLYKNELKILEFKIQVCKKRLEMAREVDKEEEQGFSNTDKVKLVFAKTTSNRVYFIEDLKHIDRSEYGDVLGALSRLEDGNSLGNSEQGKHLSESKLLRGIKEAKQFQIRILYKKLAPGIIYVMQVLQKKTDMDNGIRNDMATRNNNTSVEYKFLLDRVHDEQFLQNLIEENEIILSEINSILNSSKKEVR